MARQANLKTVISADASPMRSELAKAKNDVKNFSKTAEGALGAIGEAMGVNVGKIKEVSSAIQGMGAQMAKSSNEAVKGLGSMLKGIDALSVGIAGVGVGALIAGFQGLKAEAENFSNTIDGLNMKMAQQAWISTYKQALHDANREFGIDTAKQLNDLERGWTRFWSGTKQVAVKTFAETDWVDAALPAVGVIRDLFSTGKDISSVNNARDEAVKAADRAAQIGDRLAELTKQEVANSVEVSELTAEIAERKRILTDTTLTLEERTKAQAEAEEMIRRKSELQLPILREKAALTQELHGLSASSLEDVKEDASLQIQVNTVLRTQEEELRSLNRYSRSITNETGKQNAEYAKQLEAIRAIKQSREDLKAWSVDTSAGKIDISYSLPPDGSLRDDVNAATAAAEDAAKIKVKFQMPKAEMIDISYSLPSNESLRDDVNAATAAAEDAAKVKVKFQMPKAEMMTPVELPVKPEVDDNFQYLFDSNLGFATIHVGMELDQSKLHDISEQVQSIVENLATGLSESIGQLVGDLITGGEAWGNFAAAAMSSFADMAQAVGKMAISTGLATIGIKAALESLNGYVAIAAGAALVALGAAVKAGLKNVASGNYASAPTSVASGSYSSSSSSAVAGYNERELNVKVTGTLKASGSELVTVLNNENRRRLATT
jgi:hypothetical protein